MLIEMVVEEAYRLLDTRRDLARSELGLCHKAFSRTDPLANLFQCKFQESLRSLGSETSFEEAIVDAQYSYSLSEEPRPMQVLVPIGSRAQSHLDCPER